MNVVKKVANKIENSRIIKNPKFLVIGLIIVIVIISLIYFIFLKYSPIMNFKYEGYAISGKEITENLLGSGSEDSTRAGLNVNKNLELAKIEEQGTIFKKLNEYFVGNKEKTEINLNYPIYINNNSTIYNLAEDTTFISKEFEQIAGYPNLSISEGKIYDGNNLERTDGKEYIFVKTPDNIFINLYEIKITTTANEYTIPVNSIIAFNENSIRYYSVNNNVLVFNQISDIDNNSNVEIVENSYTYEELLTRLGIIENKNTTGNEQEEQNNIIQENTTNTENNETEDKENSTENTEQETTEGTNQGGQVYIKPEVSSTDFTAEVYTAQSTLSIKDPAGRIIEAPTFEVYAEGKLYLRRIYTNSGRITINGLKPNTEYEIKGKYIYLNENDQKVENTFYEGKFATKGYEALSAITISKENGEIYNNKIQLVKVKITSDLNAEVIKGINKIEIVADGIKTTVKNDQANMLLQGKEVTLETSEGLKSNKKIEYEIKIYDLLGEELKVENNKGETRTSKQEPAVRVTVKEQDIVSVTLDLKLTNKDNAEMENYKYIITRPNGEKVKEEKLSENEKELKIDDLDSNQYYEIKIYADYDIEDGKGMQREQEIGKLVFATQPLSTLGSIEMQVEGKDISTTKATVGYQIDEERTDKRLIQILEEIKIEIVEKETQEIAKEKEIRGEELEQIKLGEKTEELYEELKSNTTYEIRITSKVKQGSKEEEIQVTYNYKEFTTLRSTAKVEIQNQFVTGEMIDFDVRIEDRDNAVLNNKIRMELRDEDGNLVDLTEVETNKEYIRKTYDRLEENKKYKLSFYADQYNEGSTDETYKVNYLIKEIEIITEPGISGEIGLKSLLRKTTGKNLVDVESKVKWYTQCTGTWGYYEKTYNEEENTLKLWPGIINQSQSYTYDLREYIGQEVTISFQIKTEGDIKNIYLQNNKKINNNTTLIEGVTNNEYINYEKTLIVNDTGYVGISIRNGTTTDESYVYIKDLQVELGNKKTTYEPYKYNMQGEAIFSIEDKRNELVNNDYYIKVYENDEEISNKRYEDIPEENTIINGIKDIDIKENNDYKLELLVKIRDREYILSTSEFNTKNGEILGITNEEEYRDIQPEGNYIVLNDLEFRDISSSADSKYRFGGRFGFNGNLDFNGHTVYVNILSGGIQPLFYKIEEEGKIKNLNLKVYMNNELPTNGSIIFFNNSGTIENLFFSLEESKKSENKNLNLFGTYNEKTGTIENFIVKLHSKCYGYNISCINSNSGEIANGYLYGESIEVMKHSSNSNNSALTAVNNGNIKNIYSLIDINTEEIRTLDYFGKIVANNENAGHLENVYSVGLGTGYQIEKNANSGSGKGYINNSYYMNDKIFQGTSDTKTTKKVLYDKDFQNRVLNSEGKFEVDELIVLKYYPQLKMPECMPRQDYISLPEVEDADLPDIIDVSVLEQENKSALIQINVYNPAGETITNIKIKDVTATIVSQEYLNGQSKVVVKILDPIVCISKYSILSLTTKGAYNLPYVREFEDGERYVNVEFYNEIWNIDDWKEMQKIKNQNYKLMQDLDFKNETDSSAFSGISFNGVFDGNNYTISNIRILSEKSNTPPSLFATVSPGAKICNLYVKNYFIESNYYYLSIFGSARSAIFENVHLENITIESNTKGTGANNTGLIGNTDGGTIRNFTANNVKIKIFNKTSEIYIGGISGLGSTDIENSYINNLYIEEGNNSSILAVGGIIGNFPKRLYDIKNTYVKGNIIANSGNIGGIIGFGSTSIKNSVAYVDIIGNGDYIGGLIGRENESEGISNNNLYIGNIINKKLEGVTGKIVGNDVIGNNNYVYSINKINGELVEGNNKLNNENLKNIDTYNKKLKFDNNYDYSNINKGVLPMLKFTESEELLPNQTEIYLPQEELNIESMETLKTDSNNLQVQVVVSNPKEYEIKEIVIDDMEYSIISNRSEMGKTYITIKAIPIKYYDTYRISKVIYINGEEEESKELFDLIKESFYKEINSYEDWQNIDLNSYENYRLLADIDFSNKSDIKHNIKINKLITDGNMHTLKNIDLNIANLEEGLITEIKSSLENVKFENIKLNLINQNLSGDFVGVIVYNNGNINNVFFKDITINLNEKINNVGCIAKNTGLYIENIGLENVNISANKIIGGLFGRAGAKYIKEINATNIHIKGTNLIGGVIGRRDTFTTHDLTNITIKDSTIFGTENVGGIYGAGEGNLYFAQNLEVINCQIEGTNQVGGIAGSSAYHPKGINNVKVVDSKIIGTSKVGGIFGTGGSLYYGIIEDSEIIANDVNSYMVGGIVGSLSWSINQCGVIDTKIQSLGIQVGGILGYGSSASSVYSIDNTIEAYSKVGGIVGETNTGTLTNSYTNSDIRAINDYAGGIIGYLDNILMDNQTNVSKINKSYYVRGVVKGKENVGGIIGGIAKELYDKTDTDYYTRNYIEGNLISENEETTSLGIGSNAEENKKITSTYYYKYSKINGKNPNIENEAYINEEQYLIANDLKLQTTYTQKLTFSKTEWYFEPIQNNKYPLLQLNNSVLEGQKEINLPVDEENIINDLKNNIDQQKSNEIVEQIFEYDNKTIKTYSTYSVITAEDGSKVTRNTKLYMKDNNLYAIPVVLTSTSEDENITPVADNLILGSYNGKEYETVLGSDGKLYDLKEPIKYPENFVNEEIESIGNNLNSNSHEVEVVYKNGDKIKFNYQTGEVISSSEENSSGQIGILDYIKKKISKIGDTSNVTDDIKNKYEESKELQSKLEETSVEEAIEKQNESNSEQAENIGTATENNETNNSYKENKYISIYNEETGEYEIFNEEELLDTSKEEVVSENEKIEANNLNEYYASGVETKNTKMGIVWIVVSIIGVGIILFVLKKNLKKKA